MFSIVAQWTVALVVLWLPGYVWLTWIPPVYKDRMARFAEALGLSLALIALAGMLAFFVGFRWTSEALFVVYGILGLLGMISLGLWIRQLLFEFQVRYRAARVLPNGDIQGLAVVDESESAPEEISWWSDSRVLAVLVIGFLGILAWRFFQVRELILPAWVDSLHHVLIVNLFLELGGVPASFQPYMPVPFYYHFGFHSSAALFTALSNLPSETAVLRLGQILNAGVALGVYRLGISLWDDWRKAGLAGLLVGFVSQMPAYYATWGRYTLLAGLIILPIAMAVAVEIVRGGGNRERGVRLAVLTAGILLTHYFAALLLAIFLVVAFLYRLVSTPPEPGSRVVKVWRTLIGGSVLGFLAVAPWLYRVWGFARGYTNFSTVSSGASLDEIYFSDYLGYLWYLMGPDRNYLLLGMAVGSLLIVGWRRKTLPLAIWGVFLLALVSPWGPRLNPFRPDHAAIVLFLPVTLLVADALITIGDRLNRQGAPWLGSGMVGLVVFSLLVYGVRDTSQILNPVTVLADRADLEALNWIETNTPEAARFYINVTPWQTGVYRGVDGGWWILPRTGRETLVPPTMYVLGDLNFVNEVNAWASRATNLTGCTPDFYALLADAGLDYLYVKEGQGNLQSAVLVGCPGLQVVYDQDGVTIIEFVP